MSERNVTPGRFPGRVSPRTVLIVVIAVVLIALISTAFYVVDPQEEAVVLLFGRFSRIEEPGLHFKLPFGIERNFNVGTERVYKMEFGFRTLSPGVATIYSSEDYSNESVMLTGDKNIVDVEWIIQYRITDPVAWLFNVQDQPKTIRDISQSVVNLLVGDRTILGVMGTDRTAIQANAQEVMNDRFNEYGLGIRVSTVAMQDILPPAGAVRDAFEDVNKAEQDKERFINEGNEAYNQAIPEARGKARRLIQEAEGYRAARVNRANGDVARFNAVLQEYAREPQITSTRLYIEMFEEVFGAESQATTELIDRNLENFIPFKSLGTPTQPGGVQ
jgi:membrane protease subunit HflK